MAKKKKDFNPLVKTPVGICNYIFFTQPDSGRQYSDDKFKCDIMFDMETWKDHADMKELRKQVLAVGRKAIADGTISKLQGELKGKDPDDIKAADIKLKHFANPFKTGNDKDMSNEAYHCYKDKMFITPKKHVDQVEKQGLDRIVVIGPNGKELSDEEVSRIKSGDYIRAVVSVYPYSQQGGGVTLGLETVQFAKVGEALFTGGVKAAAMNVLDELDIDLEEIDDEELESGGVDDSPDAYSEDEMDDVEL